MPWANHPIYLFCFPFQFSLILIDICGITVSLIPQFLKEGEGVGMGVRRKGSNRVSEDPEELTRVPLQAILLADSFAAKFRPITLERPKVISLSLSRLCVSTCVRTYMMLVSVFYTNECMNARMCA